MLQHDVSVAEDGSSVPGVGAAVQGAGVEGGSGAHAEPHGCGGQVSCSGWERALMGVMLSTLMGVVVCVLEAETSA